MSDEIVSRGLIFRCEVCGAEVLVLKAGGGTLDPHCCNQPMKPAREVLYYRCPVCGSEAVVLKGEARNLELICCNRPMDLIGGPMRKSA
jgi:desulfoferrodoxin-like iron-binding protein